MNKLINFLKANYITQTLNLGISGPLQGVFMFHRHKYTSLDYLKKCSSVLGRSTILSNDIEIVFTDSLDLNVLISNDTYEASKKGSNTYCTGYEFIV